MVSVVKVGVSGEAAEGQGRSDFGSGKGAEVTGIRQAWWERGRIRGGEHGQQTVWASQGTQVCWYRYR